MSHTMHKWDTSHATILHKCHHFWSLQVLPFKLLLYSTDYLSSNDLMQFYFYFACWSTANSQKTQKAALAHHWNVIFLYLYMFLQFVGVLDHFLASGTARSINSDNFSLKNTQIWQSGQNSKIQPGTIPVLSLTLKSY